MGFAVVAGVSVAVQAVVKRLKKGPGARGNLDEDPEYLTSLEVAMRIATIREKEIEEEEKAAREREEKEDKIYEEIV